MKKLRRLFTLSVLCMIFGISCITAVAGDTKDQDTYYIEFDAAGGQLNGEATASYSSKKTDFKSLSLSEYTPVRDGFTFTGWYNGKKKVTQISSSDFTEDSNSICLTATYSKNSSTGSGLTFTLNANGGTIGGEAAGTYDFDVTDYKYAVSLSSYTPKKDGFKFEGWNTAADGSGQTVDLLYHSDFEKAPDGGYDYTDIDESSGKRNLTFYAKWSGEQELTGKITIGKKSWSSLEGGNSFDSFYNKAVVVSISAGKDVNVSYLISKDALSGDALASESFSEYSGEFTIEDDGRHIIYAKLSGKSGKTAYISSEGFTLDTHAPFISGVTGGHTYCSSIDITIKESHLDKITLNGSEVSLNENGQLTLSPAKGTQTITVTDKAGHKTEISVTINKDHTAAPDDGDCTTPVKCKYCKEILKDGNSAHTFSKWEENGNSTHSRHCTNKGCGFKVTQDCYGGNATCTKKAVCFVCGAEYGSVSKTNHVHLKKTSYVAATSSKEGNIDYWYCSDCGKYFANKTCTKEISKDDTIISKVKPSIIGGQNTKWKRTGTDTLKFRSDADYADFICVLVDGNELSSSYYTKREGSIIVEISPSFLDTLSIGYHTVTIRSKTGDASTNFTIEAKDPDTTATTTEAATTTESTTEDTTSATTEDFEWPTASPTTEDSTTETTTREKTTTEETTEITEKNTLDIESYKSGDSVDKRKDRVHNLKIVILITVLATILISFAIILISSGLKKK